MNILTAARPSAKSVRVLGRGCSISPLEGTPAFLLNLRVGDARDFYTLERIPSDFGDAFKVVKDVGDLDEERPTYHVNLSDEGHSCTCPGHIYSTAKTGKPCSHVAALVALRAAGRI